MNIPGNTAMRAVQYLMRTCYISIIIPAKAENSKEGQAIKIKQHYKHAIEKVLFSENAFSMMSCFYIIFLLW